jgi:Tfp pilus assembly protein PilN
MLFSQENWLISELVSKYCNLTSLIDQVSGMIKELQTLEEPEKELEQEELGFRELTAERLVEVLSGK